MCETVYSSVIWVDGIFMAVDHPWEPAEYDLAMLTLETLVGFRADIDKMTMDAMLFGTGMAHVSGAGIRHIPISEWRV